MFKTTTFNEEGNEEDEGGSENSEKKKSSVLLLVNRQGGPPTVDQATTTTMHMPVIYLQNPKVFPKSPYVKEFYRENQLPFNRKKKKKTPFTTCARLLMLEKMCKTTESNLKRKKNE